MKGASDRLQPLRLSRTCSILALAMSHASCGATAAVSPRTGVDTLGCDAAGYWSTAEATVFWPSTEVDGPTRMPVAEFYFDCDAFYFTAGVRDEPFVIRRPARGLIDVQGEDGESARIEWNGTRFVAYYHERDFLFDRCGSDTAVSCRRRELLMETAIRRCAIVMTAADRERERTGTTCSSQ